ncbi:MAG: hypothetical protein ABJN26_14370 [Stappiaceae bacterium]
MDGDSHLGRGCSAEAYDLVAGRTRRSFQCDRARKRMGYAGGAVMMGGFAMMAATRNPVLGDSFNEP